MSAAPGWEDDSTAAPVAVVGTAGGDERLVNAPVASVESLGERQALPRQVIEGFVRAAHSDLCEEGG